MNDMQLTAAAHRYCESLGHTIGDPYYLIQFFRARAEIREHLRMEEAITWTKQQFGTNDKV